MELKRIVDRVVERVLPFAVLAMGAVAVRLAISGSLVRYVKQSLRPWLGASGLVIVAVAILMLLRRPASHQHDAHNDDHDHGEHDGQPDDDQQHDHASVVSLLLLLPVVAIIAIAPPPLGSFALSRSTRSTGGVVVRTGTRSDFPPLARSATPIEMPLFEVQTRVATDGIESVAGQPLTVTGFVVTGSENPIELARFRIACCAADAAPAIVGLDITGATPTGDSWVTIVGTVTDTKVVRGLITPIVSVVELRAIPVPVDPYESG